MLSIDEPVSYSQAAQESNWRVAIQREMDSIKKNKTWLLIDLPTRHKLIGLNWVFKLKRDTNRVVIKHKAHLVVKGYVEKHRIDYEEVFAPVTCLETVRLLLALTTKN